MGTEIRRKDRQISDAEARGILERGEYGVLSMCTDEQGGYGIPVNYAIWNGAVYFHCAVEGSKLRFIGSHPRVSFCVVGATEVMPEKFGTKYESVIVSGTAAETKDDDEKREALRRLIEKYSLDFRSEGEAYIDKYWDRTKVYKIGIDSLTGKARKA